MTTENSPVGEATPPGSPSPRTNGLVLPDGRIREVDAAGSPSTSPRTNGLALPDGRVREDNGARINIFLSLEQRRSLAGRG